jgi:hypothetical protein
VMERTSQGYLSSDQYPLAGADPERVNLPWKLFAVFFVCGVLVGTLGAFSRVLGVLAGWLLTFVLPAAVMTLCNSNSLAAALNPAQWWMVVRGIGKPYIALFVFLAMLSNGAGHLLPIVVPLVPAALRLAVFNFVFLYFNMVMFIMMGYALYQYHSALGVDIEIAHEQQAEVRGAAMKPRDPAGDTIAEMIAAGDLAGALDVAYEDQRTNTDNLASQDRYHRLLLMAGKTERAASHAQNYMATLQRTHRPDQALGVFRRIREVDERFQPEATESILILAKAAVAARDPALALNLVRGFDKRFPHHRDIPAVYLLSAKILSDAYRKDDLASAVLEGMLKKYPEHPLAEEARTLLKVLQTLVAKRTVAAPARAN